MQKTTKPTKQSNIKRAWYLIDVEDKVLGRISSHIALLLMGKSKPYFVKNLDCGDYVVVINARKVKVTGKKEEKKIYTRYSGYPGGLSRRTVKEVREKNASELVRHAVSGMLPKNKLRDRMLKRLYVFSESEHPYSDKIKDQILNIKNTN